MVLQPPVLLRCKKGFFEVFHSPSVLLGCKNSFFRLSYTSILLGQTKAIFLTYWPLHTFRLPPKAFSTFLQPPCTFRVRSKRPLFKCFHPVLFEQKETELLCFAPLCFLNQNQQNFIGAFLSRVFGNFWNVSQRPSFGNDSEMTWSLWSLNFAQDKCHSKQMSKTGLFCSIPT